MEESFDTAILVALGRSSKLPAGRRAPRLGHCQQGSDLGGKSDPAVTARLCLTHLWCVGSSVVLGKQIIWNEAPPVWLYIGFV